MQFLRTLIWKRSENRNLAAAALIYFAFCATERRSVEWYVGQSPSELAADTERTNGNSSVAPVNNSSLSARSTTLSADLANSDRTTAFPSPFPHRPSSSTPTWNSNDTSRYHPRARARVIYGALEERRSSYEEEGHEIQNGCPPSTCAYTHSLTSRSRLRAPHSSVARRRSPRWRRASVLFERHFPRVSTRNSTECAVRAEVDSHLAQR